MSYPFITPASFQDENGEHQESAQEGHVHPDGPSHVEGADAGHGHSSEVAAEDWSVQHAMDFYLDSEHLMAHVQDQYFFEVPNLNFASEGFLRKPVEVLIPNPLGFTDEHPMVSVPGSDFLKGPITFRPSKFIVVELVAAIMVAVVFISLARRMKSGKPVKGRFWNMLEAGCLFVRDDIARPSIGSQDADRFLPFLWTVFFFVLGMNLFGMIPGVGSATGSISITASLALVVFGVVLATGVKKMGVVGFAAAQAPHIELEGAMSPMKFILIPMIWAIEVFGMFIKHVVLAVRLFANMFAGHLVLGVFVAFIGVGWASMVLVGVVVPGVIGASVAISLLELLVAFIQAYVFTFLTALFIGAAIHPH